LLEGHSTRKRIRIYAELLHQEDIPRTGVGVGKWVKVSDADIP
jgi:hypothetical protein